MISLINKIKNNKATIIIFPIIILAILFWSLSYPNTSIKHNVSPFFIYVSQVAAIIGFSLFALSFMFSTRISWIEKYFGGLDKLYHIHHTIGKIAFTMLLIHPILLAVRWIPDNLKKVLWYLLPLHRKTEINIGSYALLGLTILIVFTIVIKLPYNIWKVTHKLMGVFFVLGIIHMYKIEGFIAQNIALTIYLFILSILGLIAFLHKAVFHDWLVKKYLFKVENIDKLNSLVIEISLIPEMAMFEFVPGQFCFFRFIDKKISKETHPFTICSAPGDKKVTIIVKDLGDYTSNLYKKLKIGTSVFVEGPYGSFNYKQGKQKQIWIAGGVGIAPFISWTRDLRTYNSNAFKIDLYYCVRSRKDALHLQEFKELEKLRKGFCIHLICSEEKGHLKGLDILNIHNKTVFICCSKGMRNDLLKDFKRLNVSGKNIIYEDFDFS